MKILTVLKQSFKAILSNKGRSFLTILGIVIGIGAVIGLMSLGAGVKEQINSQINSLGSTNITITSGSNMYTKMNSMSSETQQNPSSMVGTTQTLTKGDLSELEKISSDVVSNVAGYVSNRVVFKVGDLEQQDMLLGVSSEYFTLYDLSLGNGNYPSSNEVVLGAELATDLFGDTNPIGQNISILSTDFVVSGVLAQQEETSFSNPNLQAYITDTEAFKLFDVDMYSGFTAKAASEGTVDTAKSDVEDVLLKSHGITDKSLADFTVTTSKDLLSVVDSVMSMLTSFLAGIAAISLLVGGIGIMNIMLVSVTERTREIGLRKALGAKTSDILIQFMAESLVLTLIGGAFGVLVGYGIGLIASIWLDFSAIVTWDSILLAVGISSFIGLVFGIYPAARAARLNPIEALRYE